MAVNRSQTGIVANVLFASAVIVLVAAGLVSLYGAEIGFDPGTAELAAVVLALAGVVDGLAALFLRNRTGPGRRQ